MTMKRKNYINTPLLKRIGKIIRSNRNLQQISIENLAKKCKVDYSQLSRMELGKVNFSISFLFKVAKTLKINPRDLLP